MDEKQSRRKYKREGAEREGHIGNKKASLKVVLWIQIRKGPNHLKPDPRQSGNSVRIRIPHQSQKADTDSHPS
jgi:hypothetical protein